MENNELLQAIRQIVKEENEPIKQEITKINITLENDVCKKLSALFDAHQLDSEKIQSVKDTVESIEEVVDTNDTLSRVNAREIRRLKEKMG